MLSITTCCFSGCSKCPRPSAPGALKAVRFGLIRSFDRGKISQLRSQEMGATAIARQLKIVPSTVYKVLDN
ncbi:hypothetical protein QE177_05160 [Arsenophonus sp. aPb]|uniref:helix-turn-helix domain-containing protein n=1 Tax=Arsenophonus sp. aPb TaxID=3041619 RepID=UPI002469A865|nr:helix-turn-helix domain-containing protein [Arsenophonus sp. aPb]WGL99269.1 hypothetical protein QE177_05160 [Arsenophonus sp. aPb]